MELTINANAIITSASLLAAFTSLGGVIVWWIKFIERDKQQDKELKAIRKEQTLICYGLLACLKGLKEQGCNGPVTEAMAKMERYLNRAAHDEEV